MAEFRYKTDHNPDHYQFRRSIRGFYPDEPRETYSDKLADRVIVLVSVVVIVLILAGVLR
jgi:hypothetical protein